MTRTILFVAGLAFASDAFAQGEGQRLIEAAKQRQAPDVRTLIAAHADVKARQGDGATALHWAAYWGDADSVDRLVRAGADVNAANDLGVTPLFLASSQESSAAALRLLKAGANPNATHLRGTAPLMEAARAGRVETVRALLQAGADVNAHEATHDQTALMWAAVNHHPDVVGVLLKAGADPARRSRVRLRKQFVKTSRGGSYEPGAFETHIAEGEIVEVKEGGYTALLFAAQQGDVDSAGLLLEAGVPADESAPSGMSALVVAAYSDQAAVGRLLLDRGAKPDLADAGYTALHAAILRGNLELVQALIAHGASVNARVTKPSGARRQSADYAIGDTLVGATPALLAAKFAERPILRALIAAGADVRVPLPDGTTPLIAALDTATINSLTGEGLGKDRRDRNVFYRTYNTESSDDAERTVVELANALLAAGADVNTADAKGNTVLHAAAQAGMNRVIELVIARGANIDAKNRYGQTALHLADAPRTNRGGDVFAGQVETAALLRRLGAEDTPAPGVERARRRQADPR